MASISREPNGHRTIQFVARDGKRKSIRLGKVSEKIASQIKFKVERLNSSIIANCSLDNETAQWVANLGDELAEKLAAVGLIAQRSSSCLGDFLTSYVKERTDLKPNTIRNLESAKRRLIEHFGANKIYATSPQAMLTDFCSGCGSVTPMAPQAALSSEPSNSSELRFAQGSLQRIPSRT